MSRALAYSRVAAALNQAAGLGRGRSAVVAARVLLRPVVCRVIGHDRSDQVYAEMLGVSGSWCLRCHRCVG